jgi:hypothetical protein
MMCCRHSNTAFKILDVSRTLSSSYELTFQLERDHASQR